MIRLAALALLLTAAPLAARTPLGTYFGWGAFRDDRPLRCFAIAEPETPARERWRPFASIAHWPAQKVRGQLYLRTSRARRPDSPVQLSIDGRRFPLVGNAAHAWAPDARGDAAIIAAIRSGTRMNLLATAANGARFTDSYLLKGAATAIDAAALGCARRT